MTAASALANFQMVVPMPWRANPFRAACVWRASEHDGSHPAIQFGPNLHGGLEMPVLPIVMVSPRTPPLKRTDAALNCLAGGLDRGVSIETEKGGHNRLVLC
jgi:hypothetical protein